MTLHLDAPSAAEDRSRIRKTVMVAAPPEVAFRVFTEQMSAWWPLHTHKIGASPAVAAIIEPRVDGRWYERGEDGAECDWGRVLAWDPPHRVVLSWEISCDWRHDRTLHTEVEVRFVADGGGTRVDLEHRHLDRYGEGAAQMAEIFSSPGGWSGLLQRFAAAVR